MGKNQNYRSSIPTTAKEVVEQWFDNRKKKSAYFFLGGEKVGFREWRATGELEFEYGIKDGKKHGREFCLWEDGQPYEVTPYRNGKIHGTGKQWGKGGEVIITYKMTNGTGLDLRCGHENESLSEEHYWPKDGEVGYHRDWNDDEKSLTEEYYFLCGKGYHGIWRKWNSKGKLQRGYPHFYLNDSRVTKPNYLKACVDDAMLPCYRKEEDQPFRELPQEYVSQKRR